LSYFGFVDVASEYQIVHISHTGNSGSVVESIAEDNRVAHFYGDVEYYAGNC